MQAAASRPGARNSRNGTPPGSAAPPRDPRADADAHRQQKQRRLQKAQEERSAPDAPVDKGVALDDAKRLDHARSLDERVAGEPQEDVLERRPADERALERDSRACTCSSACSPSACRAEPIRQLLRSARPSDGRRARRARRPEAAAPALRAWSAARSARAANPRRRSSPCP